MKSDGCQPTHIRFMEFLLVKPGRLARSDRRRVMGNSIDAAIGPLMHPLAASS